VKEGRPLSHRQYIFLISQYYSGPGQHSSYGGLQAEQSRIWILPVARDFPLFKSIQTNSGGPPSLLFNGYWQLFALGKVAQAWAWLVLRLRMSAAIQTFPLCMHGICKENFTLYPVLLHPGNQFQKLQNLLVMGT
jgi:hypothetical protein